ncbi:MAG: hypothetical protein IOD12_16570 [Silvanigrellales bacterium]|nr:hypothetical protein [Silvanigrellales bacterium]
MVPLTELQCKVMEYILHTMGETGMPPTLREIASHFGWKAVGSAQDVVLALRKKGALMPPTPGKSRQLVPTSTARESFVGRAPLAASGSPASGSPVPFGRSAKASPGAEPIVRRGVGDSRIRLEDVVQAMDDFVFAPLLGLVQAGNPLEAIENASGDFVPFPSVGRRADNSRFFSVSVEGYSMMNVGFMPGDVLLVESAASARNGDIVLAAVDSHDVTVKRFALRGSHLYRGAFENLSREDVSLQRFPPALLVPENPDFEPIPFGLAEADRVLGLVRSLYRKEIV